MKITIATTFREFNNNENSKIQDLFLKSIQEQTHKNFRLIVTIFKEKNVEEHISKNFPNIDVVFFKSELKNHRFCLSEVLLNSIKESSDIVLWTTCDVIFDKNFFKNIIKNYSINFFGTSHPHIKYLNIENFQKKNNLKIEIEDGIDVIFFDYASILKIKNEIEKYKFFDWGVFENFLTALGSAKLQKSINIYKISKIKKILNNRSQNNEDQKWLNECLLKNRIIMDNFLIDNNIKENYYNMTYCHKKYKIVEKKIH